MEQDLHLFLKCIIVKIFDILNFYFMDMELKFYHGNMSSMHVS